MNGDWGGGDPQSDDLEGRERGGSTRGGWARHGSAGTRLSTCTGSVNPGGHHPRLADYATGSLFWVELCPPKRHVEALTPSTRDCDLVWKQGLGIPESGGSSALRGYSCPHERRRRRDTQGVGHGTAGAGAGAERRIRTAEDPGTGRGRRGRAQGPGRGAARQPRGSDLGLHSSRARTPCFSPPAATAAPGSQRRGLAWIRFPGEAGSRRGPGLRTSQGTT